MADAIKSRLQVESVSIPLKRVSKSWIAYGKVISEWGDGGDGVGPDGCLSAEQNDGVKRVVDTVLTKARQFNLYFQCWLVS